MHASPTQRAAAGLAAERLIAELTVGLATLAGLVDEFQRYDIPPHARLAAGTDGEIIMAWAAGKMRSVRGSQLIFQATDVSDHGSLKGSKQRPRPRGTTGAKYVAGLLNGMVGDGWLTKQPQISAKHAQRYLVTLEEAEHYVELAKEGRGGHLAGGMFPQTPTSVAPRPSRPVPPSFTTAPPFAPGRPDTPHLMASMAQLQPSLPTAADYPLAAQAAIAELARRGLAYPHRLYPGHSSDGWQPSSGIDPFVWWRRSDGTVPAECPDPPFDDYEPTSHEMVKAKFVLEHRPADPTCALPVLPPNASSSHLMAPQAQPEAPLPVWPGATPQFQPTAPPAASQPAVSPFSPQPPLPTPANAPVLQPSEPSAEDAMAAVWSAPPVYTPLTKEQIWEQFGPKPTVEGPKDVVDLAAPPWIKPDGSFRYLGADELGRLDDDTAEAYADAQFAAGKAFSDAVDAEEMGE